MEKQKQIVWRAAAQGLTASLLLGAGALLAQTSQGVAPVDLASPAAPTADAGAALPRLNLQVPGAEPVQPANEAGVSSSAAQSAATDIALNTAPFHFVDAQYGGRRRYGKPRYRGGNSNADGSEKYAFFAGGGFTAPQGDNSNYLTTSYGFQVGAGRNFNAHTGVNLQFDWDNFGFTGQTLNNQSNLYFNDPTNTTYGLDGKSHIWSFSLDPIYNLRSGEGVGVYITGGGGFYHKTANFTIPVPATGYDPYYGYYQYTANETIDKYSSNSAGVNVGLGFTYKFSKFANQRLYGEARYVHTFNTFRPGYTVGNVATATFNSYNFFPANSNPTTYFPVKFGIRF